MLPVPPNCIHTRSSPFWDKDSAPAGLFQRHLDKGTRPGVYPRLSVMQGKVRYLGYADSTSPEPEAELIVEARPLRRIPAREMASPRAAHR